MNHMKHLFAAMASVIWMPTLVTDSGGTRKRKDRTGARRRPANWYARRKARMQMVRESRRGNR